MVLNLQEFSALFDAGALRIVDDGFSLFGRGFKLKDLQFENGSLNAMEFDDYPPNDRGPAEEV